MKTWNVWWDWKWLWTEWESPVTANLPRSQPFTFSASLATILLRHPDWQHISLKIRPREPGSRRRETWDSRHFRFVNLFASQLFNVIDDTSCFFVVMNRRRSYWGTSHQRFKKAPGWGKHEGLSSLTKPSWLCDCLAKGDAQHLDVTFCRQENSVEDITIRFQDPSQLLEQVGQNDDFKATNISTKTLLLFIWGWEHKHSPFLMRFVGLFGGGDQRPDWWFSTSEWRWQWTAERTDEHGRSRSTTRRNTRNTRSWNEAGRWNPKE